VLMAAPASRKIFTNPSSIAWRYTPAVAGITSSRVCGCTAPPGTTIAAKPLSSLRPMAPAQTTRWFTPTPTASRAGTTSPGDAGEDQILPRHPRPQPAVKDKLHRLGDAQPQAAQRHRRGEI